MWKPIRLIAAAALAGLAGCTPQTVELPPPPAIETFLATPQELAPGGCSTLTFTTTKATRAQLVDVSGTVIHEDTTPEQGEFSVCPSETSVYLLRIEGEGGRATHFVQVAVGEALDNVALLAIPAEVRAGEEVNLLWTARNATAVTIRDAAGNVITPAGAAAGSGVQVVTPARTTSFVLTARGAAGEELSAGVTARVRPVVSELEVTPNAVKIGETMKLRFRAQGGETVTLREAVFGHLPGSPMTNPDGSSEIEVDWVVPATLPSGQAVIDGMPLVFTLEVQTSNPLITVRSQNYAVVGDGPAFLELTAPEAVTVDHPVTISWKTLNAESVRVLKDGHQIGGTLAVENERVRSGSYTYPKVTGTAPVEFTIVAENEQGIQVPRTVRVTPVPLPIISTFTVTTDLGATLFPEPGESAIARWTTSGAERVEVQLRNGIALRTIDREMIDASQIDSGQHGFPVGNSDTLVLRAFNRAGDFVQQTSSYEVEIPAALTLEPVPLVRGSSVTMRSALNTLTNVNPSAIHGFPSAESVKLTAANDHGLFVDISDEAAFPATELLFQDPSDGVVSFLPGRGFRFPFFETVAERIYVAVDGAIMLGSGRNILGTNLPFDQIDQGEADEDEADLYPTMIAPYWNDLRLGSGSRIHTYLDPTAFPRRLIVQWTDMELSGDASARLTFQIHLYETGAFDFVYARLDGGGGEPLDGAHATIGYRLSGGRATGSQGAAGEAKVLAGEALRWFRSPILSTVTDFDVDASGVLSVFLETSATPPALPVYLPFTLDLRTLRSGDLLVNEIMANPANEAPEGVWVELLNTSSAPIRLGGMALKTDGMATPLLLADDEIPPGGHYVVAWNNDPFLNGGIETVHMTVPATDLPVNAAGDSVKLLLPEQLATPTGSNTPYTSLAWGTLQAKGTSLQGEDSWTRDSSGRGFQCAAEAPFGEFQFGSPGKPNTTCFPDYTIEQIPVAFEEIANLGIPLFEAKTWEDNIATFELVGAPLTLFGRFERAVKVSTNGALAVVDAVSTLDRSWQYSNTEYPNTRTPNGSFGVYADDLVPNPSIDSNVYAARVEADGILSDTGRWIFQWKKVGRWDEFEVLGDSELNFEIKLFDNGVVEFHYGTLFSPPGEPGYAHGEDAVVMLENRAGTAGSGGLHAQRSPGPAAHGLPVRSAIR